MPKLISGELRVKDAERFLKERGYERTHGYGRISNPNRRSMRLKGYDYAQAGAYSATICTQDRACLFGDVVDDEMRLNEAGRMVGKWWLALPSKYPHVNLDEYVVMPNHFHGIVTIVGADPRVCPDHQGEGAHVGAMGGAHMGAPLPDITQPDIAGATGAHMGAPQPGAPQPGAPLPKIVQWFKTMTTNADIRGVKQSGWPSFHGRVWQRNYYEHIIRDDQSLNRIRQYIADNPARRTFDRENPASTAPEPEDAWAR